MRSLTAASTPVFAGAEAFEAAGAAAFACLDFAAAGAATLAVWDFAAAGAATLAVLDFLEAILYFCVQCELYVQCQ